ncbi:MAG: nucleotidyltransferase domain-containing protein [Nanoarchaeota archaeon]
MALLKLLQTNPGARKIFGKRELKIIEKQLWGINLTQSEKNRLSRDIRKKLEFMKEIARCSDDFSLKKGQHIKKIIEETKRLILQDQLFSKIQRIILFGSTVDNTRTFRSDIDIAVEFSEIDLKEATRFRIRISSSAQDDVDIQVFNILPEKIKKEIHLTGRVLYDRTHTR